MAVVCNLTPVPREGYRIGVPKAGAWEEVINTDATVYGGSGVHSQAGHTDAQPAHGHRAKPGLEPAAAGLRHGGSLSEEWR